LQKLQKAIIKLCHIDKSKHVESVYIDPPVQRARYQSVLGARQEGVACEPDGAV